MTAATASDTPKPLRAFEDVPGPRRLPVLGNALQLEPDRLHQQLEAWCDEFGPMFRLQIGNRRLLVVGDHQVIATVLRDRPDGFRRTARLEDIWRDMGMPLGLFIVNGDTWKRQRRMVMAGFDPAHVRRYFPKLQVVAQRLVQRWRAADEIDLQADLMRYTVDTIAGLAFGAEVNTLQSDGDVIQKHLDKIFPALFHRAIKPFSIAHRLPTRANRELAESVKQVNVAVADFVQQARQRMQANPALRERPTNLLEAMLVAADVPDSGMDDEQVAGNVLIMLLAGEDTTANTIAWMVHLLWRNPATLARAVAEVRGVVGDSPVPSFEQIAQLDYIEACAFETMRLKPVATSIPQQALRDTTVGDVLVPKGVMVFPVMRRDCLREELVPRAMAFEPERWLSAASDGDTSAQLSAQSVKRVSMPFGAGPRICPGRYLALMEMKMAMAVLLSHFDITAISTPDGQEARELLAFTMQPVGLRMRLQARQVV